MTAPSEAELCARGAAIDATLFAKDPQAAIPRYQALLDGMVASGEVSAYVGAKASLGLLYAHIAVADFTTAHGFWLGKHPETAKLWVECLEAGQLSGHDQGCYFLVEAFLHSLATDPKRALPGMKQRVIAVLNWAVTNRDDELVIAAVSNWKFHLVEIFGGANAIPATEEVERRSWLSVNGVTVPADQPRLILPTLGAWQ